VKNSCGYENLSMVGRWFRCAGASLNFVCLVLMILGLFGRNGTWNLYSGLLRLSCWTLDFNPFNHKQTHSQVWVHFHYIPLEYWQPKIIFEIAGLLVRPFQLMKTLEIIHSAIMRVY
jgi:hypothetical protein